MYDTLRHYEAPWLRHDLVAGLVMTTMLVPVGIAYAEASGVPGINGLYATIVPLLAYALFGPSRILVLGPDSALAPVILTVVLPLSAGEPQRAVTLAGMMAIVSGVVCVAAGLARLGEADPLWIQFVILDEEQTLEQTVGLLALGVHGFVSYTQIDKLSQSVDRISQGELCFSASVLEAYARRSIASPRQKHAVGGATRTTEGSPRICVVEQNHLAARYLLEILAKQTTLHAVTLEDLIAHNPSERVVHVFIVDRKGIDLSLRECLDVLRERHPNARIVPVLYDRDASNFMNSPQVPQTSARNVV